MSWFQSTNIASLAKTAFKEAQKTIDKALEISEVAEPDGSSLSSSTSEKVAAVTEAASDFFASWGVGAAKKASLKSATVEDLDSSLSITDQPGKISATPAQHKRSQSLEVSKLSSNKGSGSSNQSESLVTDIPVTLIPHPQVEEIIVPPPESESSSSSFNHLHHQRSLSDTIFNLTSDFHESVQILDEPEENKDIPTPTPTTATTTDPNSTTSILESESRTTLVSQQPDNNSSVGNPTTSENEEQEETLTTVDLNSPSTTTTNTTTAIHDLSSSWGYQNSATINSSLSNNVLFKNDTTTTTTTGFDSSSWSWTDGAEENESNTMSRFEDVELPDNENIENNTSLLLLNIDPPQEQPALDSETAQSPNQENSSLIDLQNDETDESQLESSSGTVLFDTSAATTTTTTTESNDNINDPDIDGDDKTSKPCSPPASSISAIDSPRSSSPPMHNDDQEVDSRRGSPEGNNFEMLSHHHHQHTSSKLECHPGPDFLPESSRSSSIVVVSSARASSGGSGSTASTGSGDMHRDIVDGPTGYERVDFPSSTQSSDPTSPEFIKSKHRKGPSSASSSDIEVILLSSEYSRVSQIDDQVKLVPIVSSIHQQTSIDFQDQGTQTEEEINQNQATLAANEIPNRMNTESISEKDQMISELREEGEKLSKKQFELTQVIKKLRAKEKEIENTVKTLKGEIAGKNVENDRLTKSFINKESAEKMLSDQVQKLTAEKRTLDLKIEQIHSELEDAKENCSTMKASVEDASVEILELKNAISSAQRDSTELDNLTREKSDLMSRNDSLQKEQDNLRSTINSNQGKASKRETELQNQIAIQTRKVHELENQLADVSTEVADTTMPLSLEIEKLQMELKHSQASSEKRESFLSSQVMNLESKWKSSAEKERALKDQVATQEGTISLLEKKIQEFEVENRNLKRDASFREENEHKGTQEKLAKISKLEAQMEKFTTEIERLNQENEQLGLELKSEKASLEQERKRNQNLLEQSASSTSGGGVRNINQHKISTVSNPATNNGNLVIKSGENSPSCNSVTSEASYLDEVFDPHGQILGHRGGTITPRSYYDSYSSTGLLEHLQSQLRLRETEVIQFQDEIQKNEKIRKSLNDEIAKLTMRNHEFQMEAERLLELEPKLRELDTNYNALLQLYGEKVEEADELRLDLQDVKDMYKTQIEQLLKR